MARMEATISPTGTSGGNAGGMQPLLDESRIRWRDLATLAADFACETDADGRMVFLSPDPLLGWPVAHLLDQPAARMLVLPEQASLLRPDLPYRGRRVWLRGAQGRHVCVQLAALPLFAPDGTHAGVRFIGFDMTEEERQTGELAAALRQAELLDRLLRPLRQEVLAPRMLHSMLVTLTQALGATGAAVVRLPEPPDLADLVDPANPAITAEAGVVQEIGQGLSGALPAACALLGAAPVEMVVGGTSPTGQILLACRVLARLGEMAGIVIWRAGTERAWDAEDQMLLGRAAALIGIILDHDAVQREMARQARTDPLTGLFNRRAFLEELPRRIERLDREQLPAVLLYADLDGLKTLNDNWGHERGDVLLCAAARMLRDAVRPTDLVARLGGDEFAIWMDGADPLTAAERAEALRLNAPTRLVVETPAGSMALSFSIGIAGRDPGSFEDIDALLRRADLAMYEVKRNGRGHWRVSRPPSP